MEKSTTETQPMGESALEAIDTRAICFMRAALAASGLVTVGLTGLPLSEQPAAGYTVLLLYTLYSLLLFGVSMHRSPVLHSKIWHWGDLAWITGLVMLNEKVPATLSLFLLLLLSILQ